MTDFKPYSRARQPLGQRQVALVIDVREADDLLFRRLGPRTNLERVVDLAQRTVEARQTFVCATSDAALDAVRRLAPEVPVLPVDASHALRPGQVQATHLLWLRPGFPWLRPSTVDEAARLLCVRSDFDWIASCVACNSPLIDECGEGVARPQNARWYRLVDALWAEPAYGARRDEVVRPYPFEIMAQEGFSVRGEFESSLADALLSAGC